MYCKNCGKQNAFDDKYCKSCGRQIVETITELQSDAIHSEHEVDSTTHPYPYVISIKKLIVMSVCTFGLYDIYWFYMQWKSYKSEKSLNATPALRALFAPIFSYTIFKEISNSNKEIHKNKGVEAGAYAILYFFLCRVWFLSFLPLIPIQNAINYYWEQKLGKRLVRSKFGAWNWIVVIAFALLLVYGIDTSDSPQSSVPVEPTAITATVVPQPTPAAMLNLQSVVNLWCDNKEGGSGMLISKDGLVLTNNHVVAGSKLCVITLPDQTTGSTTEIYQGFPTVIPKLSKQYDIATVTIVAPYEDADGKVWGTHTNDFPSFNEPESCPQYVPQLGDAVKIYGYPVTSGGYNLTITDGIISSFSDVGYILTSAKIDNGNSGGLAINGDGCWLGIPSAVVSGNHQNLGVIIPLNIIQEYANLVAK